MKHHRDAPDIVILPPVLFLGAAVLGIVIHYFIWRVQPLPPLPSRISGAVLLLASGYLAHRGHKAMERAGTNVLPTKPALALVHDGPYRVSRNPLYIAVLGIFLGVALLIDSLAMVLLLLPVIAVLQWGVVLREERYLTGKFGDDYRAYCARVRRWI